MTTSKQFKHRSKKESYTEQMYENIMNAFSLPAKCPHCLIELSGSELHLFKDNCMTLSGLSICQSKDKNVLSHHTTKLSMATICLLSKTEEKVMHLISFQKD